MASKTVPPAADVQHRSNFRSHKTSEALGTIDRQSFGLDSPSPAPLADIVANYSTEAIEQELAFSKSSSSGSTSSRIGQHRRTSPRDHIRSLVEEEEGDEAMSHSR
jgi:hypothetical protein